MDYSEFCHTFIECIKRKAPSNIDISFHQIPKNNGIVRDALVIFTAGKNIAPTICLQEQYHKYEEGCSIEDLTDQVVYEYSSLAFSSSVLPEIFTEFSSVRSSLRIRLIHHGYNQSFLEEIPHTDFLDLAVIYYYLLPPSVMGDASVIVKMQDLKRWQISLAELHDIALQNTIQAEPYRCVPLRTVISELLEAPDPNCEDRLLDEMYILTNQSGRYGATCLVYDHVLAEIAARFSSDLILLPSSIHEIIVLKKQGSETMDEYKKMICEINETQVAPEEVLSDHAYLYDRKLNHINYSQDD